MEFEINGVLYQAADCQLPEYDDDGVSTYWERRNHMEHPVKYIICHCMDATSEVEVTTIFRQYKVSAHYVVTPCGDILCYVDPDHVAYHAGQSAFDSWDETPVYVKPTITNRPKTLNYNSIGIEFLCPGYAHGGKNWYHFEPFTESQIKVGLALIQYLTERFQIHRDRILGHSDIAPFRRSPSNLNEVNFAKSDPGATFFWKELADIGISMPLPNLISSRRPTIDWIQETLRIIGYCLVPVSGILDLETVYVLIAFQLHFVPGKFTDETYADTAITKKSYDLLIDGATVGALEELRRYKSIML